MSESATASAAISMAVTLSVHSMTVLLLASDSSSILFIRAVMRLAFSVICWLTF